MKRSFLISFIILIAAFSMFSATTADEKVTLKGSVSVANKIHPEFKSNGKDYQLLMPRFELAIDLKDGDQAEIEGFKISKELLSALGMFGRQIDATKDIDYLVVTKITYNGKTIDVAKEMADFRAKMMQERGPGMKHRMDDFKRGNPGPQQN